MLSSNQPKYSTFGGAASIVHPREAASWFSQVFLTWCTPLVHLQYALNIEDIWQLEAANTAESNTKRFLTAFGRSKSVFRACANVYGAWFAVAGVLGLVLRLLELVGPIVLQKIVGATNDRASSHLYYWLAVLLVSKVARAILWSHMVMLEDILGIQYVHIHPFLGRISCVCRFVGGLKGALFQRLVSKASVQPGEVPDLANVYSADMDNLLWASISFNNLWIMPTQILVISYLLYQELGVAAFAGFGMLLLSLCLGTFISTIQSKAFDRVSTARDDRMQAVKETFGSILIVKLHAWEQRCRAKIQSLRDIEMGHVWTLMFSGAISIFVLWASPLFVSMTSFAMYTMVLGQPLTASKVFTALALFRLLQNPMSEIPDDITVIVEAKVSLDRIQEYLDQADQPTRPAPAVAPESQDTVIAIENGTFTWGDDGGAPILKNVSLTVSRGDLVVVHGKVGSGKSSLCMAILGEMHQTEGTTGVYGSTAYCSQEPWIQQMSVRDNILFGSPFDSRKYTRVVEACGLLPDFGLMAFGDLTEVGSKGRNLSGGQKARISLARACYSDADIVILDAPLAAIDAVVQKQIMTKCVETLLKTRTVILVTHNGDIISSPNVNRLLELDDGGMDFVQVKPSGQLPQVVTEPVGSSSTHYETDDKTRTRTFSASFVSPRLLATHNKWREHFELALSEDTNDEVRAEGHVDTSVYGAFISACGGTSTVVLICVIQSFWQGFQIASDVWLGQWTASSDAAERTTWYMGVYAACCFGSVVMVLCRSIAIATSGLKASRHLFDSMTTSLLGTTMSFYDANPIGRVINRYAQDTASIDTRLPYSFGGLTAMFFAVVGSLLTSLAVVQWFGLLFLPILHLYVRLSQMYLRPSRELSRLKNITNSPVLTYLDEIEHGFSLLRAFGTTYLQQAIDRHAHHVNVNHQMWYAKVAVDMWFETCISLQGTAIVMIVATGLVVFRSALSAGLVGLAFNYVLMADACIVDLVKTYSSLEVGMVAPERVLQYCGLENEDPSAHSTASLTLTKGAISFNKVQFRYKPTSELVLRDLSCDIAGGEKIGIVGRTGAGKSSLTMVLFRMYPLVSGSILLDGRDIATVAKQDLRRHLSIIPQSPVLFKGTLRQYLDPFGSFDDAALWSVVSKAGLHPLVSDI
ncbi:hypothetical protein B5M09_012287, partial [Aphanomyces astaci]